MKSAVAVQTAKSDVNEVLGFGPFRLAPAQRSLSEGNRPVRLGSRALEILIASIENAGQVVSHEVPVARTWPSTVVEDTSLRVHIAALRKALGDGQGDRRSTTNVPGRGYCFVAPVERVRPLQLVGSAVPVPVPVPSPTPTPTPGTRHSNLPTLLGTVVGRNPVLRSLTEMIALHRLVTVVRAGGMGKT